jgi:endonuclease YncB( thermonuclease family)
VRWLLLVLLLGAVGACASPTAPNATPRTALEQRLAQGAGPRPPSPTASPTLEPVTPEPTWTPAPFGRRTTPTAVAPLTTRSAAVVRVESEQAVAVRIDGRDQPIAFVGVLPLGRTQLGHPVDCFGHEATAMLRRLMPVGSLVEVEEDGVAAARDDRGRPRLYVWLPDGRLANMELVRQGFGQVAPTDSGARHYQALRQVEREAAREGLGLWSTLTCYDNPSTRGVPG